MSVFRPLLVLLLSALPSAAATFGTVVAHAQPLADLAIDEARRRVYVVNTASNQVEVYATNVSPPRQTNVIRTTATPLAAAISRSGRYLYVACYGASALDIIDLSTTNFSSRSVTLAASPQAVAVGYNEKVLISTIATGTGQNALITYDPNADAAHALSSVVIAPPPPSAPALPPPNGVIALASHARLEASRDGRTIIGVHELANNTRTVFVFDVNSSTVLGSRNVPVISPVLAVSADGSRFLSGPMLFESSTMLVMAQQSAANSPYVFPATANFNVQTSQGGAVYAQVNGANTLITAYNIVPVQNPAARANTSQLIFNNPDNMLIQLGIQVPEALSGKMAITSDSSTIYAISQSGFMVLPIGTIQQNPIAMPDSNVALLASDQCGTVASLNSATIPVRNIGSRTMSTTVQVLATSTTATSVRVTARPYGGDVTATFSAGAARTIGTATPDQLLVQSPEAINIIPTVRIFQNNRNSESRGTILPIDSGPTAAGLTDMISDLPRQRLYIANPGLNRVEVFDTQKQQFLSPISVGQLPRSMALGNDGNTLYVANSGSETVSVVDLAAGAVVGRVNLPPIPFNASFAVITPLVVANSQRGPQVLMSDGTLWKIVGNTMLPRTLNPNIFGAVRSIPGPGQTMTATPDGAYVLLLAGNGNAYLYDSSTDDFVSARLVIGAPIQGYFGPIAAGPNGQYYLVDDQLLNPALTSIGTAAGTTGPVGGGGLPTPGGPTVTGRPVAAVAAINGQTYARFSTAPRASTAVAPADPGLIEVVEASTQRTTAVAPALEGPLAAAVGTARVNVSGRTMAVDAGAGMAYILTASGLSIIPLASSNQPAPQLAGTPVVNTANFTAAIAPGGLITIVGRNLATDQSASGTPLPTILGGTCITLNNAPLPLLMTSPTQINAQIPPTLAAGRYPLVVRSTSSRAASGTATVTVARFAPAIFFDSPGGPAIFHQDGTRVNKAHPASRDEPLTIMATGLGVTTGGRVTAGMPSPASPLAVTAPVQLFFGNPTIREAAVIVDSSTLVPGLIGVYQIKCRIPGTHLKGDALPVTIRIGGVSNATTGPTAAVVYVN